MIDRDTIFPVSQLTQGDTFNWAVDLSSAGYTPDSWILKYTFKKYGVDPFTLTCTTQNGIYLLNASPTVTDGYPYGRFVVVAAVFSLDGENKFTVGQTELTIQPNMISNLDTDPRSHNQQMLDSIDKALAACLTDATTEYTIGGKSVKMNKIELQKMRQVYVQKVKKENGLKTGNMIQYGFAPLHKWGM